MNQTPKPIIIRKSVKHTFSPEERLALNNDLLVALEAKTNSENEFDSVKATYKAKITEAESKVGLTAAMLRAGWEMRVKDCEVRFRPMDRKKDFFIQDAEKNFTVPVLTEEMTSEDFEQDLIRAESIFSKKTEIGLWIAGEDRGKIIVGQLAERWYSAVRCNVGKERMEERLDSEQMSFKLRFDAVQRASKRCLGWLTDILGKDKAKGFVDQINAKVEAEKDKVE